MSDPIHRHEVDHVPDDVHFYAGYARQLERMVLDELLYLRAEPRPVRRVRVRSGEERLEERLLALLGPVVEQPMYHKI